MNQTGVHEADAARIAIDGNLLWSQALGDAVVNDTDKGGVVEKRVHGAGVTAGHHIEAAVIRCHVIQH